MIVIMLLCTALIGYGCGYLRGCEVNEKFISEYRNFSHRCLQHAKECLRIANEYEKREKKYVEIINDYKSAFNRLNAVIAKGRK